jgi:deoxyribonuclease V
MNLKKKLAEAQRRLSSRLILKWDGREVNLMAGADFGYSYREKKIGASIVVFKIPEFEIVEVSEAIREIEVPYLPGFLAYREGPAFLDAFRKIKNEPDVTLVDGNGIAHPRKMGLASFLPFCFTFGEEGGLHSF